jgi:hypothetical protein
MIKKKNIITGFIAVATIASFVVPSAVSVSFADETTTPTDLTPIEITQSLQVPDVYATQEEHSQEALATIQEKYADTDVSAVLADTQEITPEMTNQINQAITDYMKLVGYNPRLRGFGRNWWNSRGFIGGVFDAAFIAIGFGAGIRSGQALMQIIRANRRNITRVIESQIAYRLGLGGGAWLGAALDIVGAVSGVSLGGAIAWGIDYVDGKRLDGYIFA